MRGLLFKRIIFTFQMGKVGSTSVFFAIQKFLEESDGTHSFIRGNIGLCENSKYILASCHRGSELKGFYGSIILWRARLGLPLSVICPIREPIARDVSAFFNVYCPLVPGLLENADLGELEELFLSDSRPADEFDGHPFALNWFDKHLNPLTRIDVYKKPFPIDRKWQTYSRGSIRVLIYRIDLKRSEQKKQISRFLGIELDEFRPQNVTKNKNYAEHYSQFRESVKLPEQYIRLVHGSRFARHFWSSVELKATADKWRGVSGS